MPTITENEKNILDNFHNCFENWKTGSKKNTGTFFSKELDIAQSMLTYWLQKERQIPEKYLEKIASIFKINVADLTMPYESEQLETAYVLLSFRGSDVKKMLKCLYLLGNESEIVKEAAIIYGERGGFVKLQAKTSSEIGEFIREKLRNCCESTATMPVVEKLYWQRAQTENLTVLKGTPNSYHIHINNISEYIENIRTFLKKTEQEEILSDHVMSLIYNDKLEKALNGIIYIDQEDKVIEYRLKLLKKIKHSLNGIIMWESLSNYEITKFKEYVNFQIELLKKKPSLKIERVFLSEKEKPDNDLLLEMQRQYDAGIKVFYLTTNKWNSLDSQFLPQDFGIFDEENLLVYGDQINSSLVRTATLFTSLASEKKIAAYSRLFKVNKDRAQPYSPDSK